MPCSHLSPRFTLGVAGVQVGVQNYQDWIRLVAELTVNSLNAWHWSGSSVYYLLGLWSRLVSSMPYLKGDSPSLLDTFVPKISRAYINSRLVHASSAPLTIKSSHALHIQMHINEPVLPTAADLMQAQF